MEARSTTTIERNFSPKDVHERTTALRKIVKQSKSVKNEGNLLGAKEKEGGRRRRAEERRPLRSARVVAPKTTTPDLKTFAESARPSVAASTFAEKMPTRANVT